MGFLKSLPEQTQEQRQKANQSAIGEANYQGFAAQLNASKEDS